MAANDRSYHLRRAQTQQLLADQARDPAIAGAHHALSALHIAKAGADERRPALTLFPRIAG